MIPTGCDKCGWEKCICDVTTTIRTEWVIACLEELIVRINNAEPPLRDDDAFISMLRELITKLRGGA